MAKGEKDRTKVGERKNAREKGRMIKQGETKTRERKKMTAER